MSDTTTTDQTSQPLENSEFGLRIRTALRAERAGYFSEVTKALVAVNSGGAITMITVMGSLAKAADTLAKFKSLGCLALLCFSAGLVAAIFVPIALADHVEAVRDRKGNSKGWIAGAAIILGLSFTGLIAGLGAATYGAYSAF